MEKVDVISIKRKKLQLGDIGFELSNTPTLKCSFRYKPEDESEHDTDHYGYVQTRLQPVMTLRNLSEEEVAQIKEFAETTMAEGTIKATRKKSLAEKLQDRVNKAIE
ncbi:MAG: hypothetical protein ABEJ36_04615 [Candidatus Nanosalina sp.]